MSVNSTGQVAINECEEKLRQYANGIFEDSSHHVYMTERIANVQKSLKATFWVQNKNAIYNIEDTPAGRNYQSNNQALLNRGVRIERIFILNKEDLIDSEGRFSDIKSLRIMELLLSDGADIRISWLDEWGSFTTNSDLYRDFGILDEQEVVTHIYGAWNTPTKTLVIKNGKQVAEYKEIFSKIRKLSHPLGEILDECPPIKT